MGPIRHSRCAPPGSKTHRRSFTRSPIRWTTPWNFSPGRGEAAPQEKSDIVAFSERSNTAAYEGRTPRRLVAPGSQAAVRDPRAHRALAAGH